MLRQARKDRRSEPPAVHADPRLRRLESAKSRANVSAIGLFDDVQQRAVVVDGQHGVAADAVRIDVALRDERRSAERRQAWAVERDERPQHVDGVVVVGVEDEERRVCRRTPPPTARRQPCRAPPAERQRDAHALGRARALVVVADDVVLGSDDEADVQAAGVGERAQDVVEERPPKRDHRLQPACRRRSTAPRSAVAVRSARCILVPLPRARTRAFTRAASEERVDRADAQENRSRPSSGCGIPVRRHRGRRRRAG